MTAAPAEASTLSPTIKLAGTAIGDLWLHNLVAVRVERGLNLVGQATLRFRSNGFDLAQLDDFAMTDPVEILSGTTSLITATVVGRAVERTLDGTELVITARDASHKLATMSKAQAFLNKSASTIVTELAQEAGMTTSVVSSTTTHPYLLQTGTHLALIDALCAHHGMAWYVDGKKFVAIAIEDAVTATVTLKPLVDLFDLSVRVAGTGPEKITVRGWDPTSKDVIVGSSGGFFGTDPTFASKAAGRGTQTVSQTTLDYHGAVTTRTEAQKLADTRLAEVRAASVVVKGTCYPNPGLAPGAGVSIAEGKPLEATYLVTSVDHRYTPATGFRTRFVAGPVRPAGLVDLFGARATQETGLTFPDVFTAVVTNNTDDTNEGRVKVKYSTRGDQVESEWARILMPGAGPDRGMLFVPEVNDEVLVVFERGDTRRPIVLGALYSGKDKPKPAGFIKNAKVATRSITSRLGHVIEMGDGDGDADKHLRLELVSGVKLRLGADKTDLDSADTPILIKSGDASIELKDGKITIKGKELDIQATTGNLAAKAPAGNLTIDAKQVAIEGKLGTEVKGLKVAVQAQTMAEIKGAMVKIN